MQRPVFSPSRSSAPPGDVNCYKFKRKPPLGAIVVTGGISASDEYHLPSGTNPLKLLEKNRTASRTFSNCSRKRGEE